MRRQRKARRRGREAGRQKDPVTLTLERWKLVVAVAAAVITTAGSGLSAFFDLFPKLKPEEPPENLSATVKTLRIDRRVPAGDPSRPLLDYCYPGKPEPEQEGVVIYVEASIVGFKDREAQLNCSVYSEKESKRLTQGEFSGSNAVEGLVSEAAEDRAVFQVWVPLPRRSGRFFVRFELYDKKPDKSLILLSLADSQPFLGEVHAQ